MSNLVHDLNINEYSFSEILTLFNISSPNITDQHIKTAKRKLAQIHPDKSKLPPEYFVFFKAAYDRILYHYNKDKALNEKMESNISKANIGYNPTEFKIEKSGEKYSNAAFEHITDYNKKIEIAKQKNSWFSDASLDYEKINNIDGTNGSGMRTRLVNNSLVVKQEIKPLYLQSAGGSNFYDDDDESNDTEYITCDMFGKLKYDDIRKVHNDFTVTHVDMNSFSEKGRPNIEQLKQEQARVYVPINKHEADAVFLQKELQQKEQDANKKYKDYLRSEQYKQRQQYITGNQLRLA